MSNIVLVILQDNLYMYSGCARYPVPMTHEALLCALLAEIQAAEEHKLTHWWGDLSQLVVTQVQLAQTLRKHLREVDLGVRRRLWIVSHWGWLVRVQNILEELVHCQLDGVPGVESWRLTGLIQRSLLNKIYWNARIHCESPGSCISTSCKTTFIMR